MFVIDIVQVYYSISNTENKNCTPKIFTKNKKTKLKMELHRYPRIYAGVLTFHRHNCAAACRFLDFKSIWYHSLASRNWATASTEVSQHSMPSCVSLTLSARAAKEACF